MSTNDKKDKNEELFDHIIEYGAGRWTDEISPDNIPEEELSDQLNQKIDTMFSSARKRANRKRRFITARRIAAVFVVLLTMASVTVMSVEAFREPIINFIFKTTDSPNKTRIDVTQENHNELNYSFDYMPRGYSFKKRVINGAETNLTYQFKNENDSIYIDILSDVSYSIYSYIEDKDYKKIQTSGVEYFYVQGEYKQLIWAKDKSIFSIYAKCSSEEMIKIAQHIKKKK